MSLGDYLRAIWRSWIALLVCALIGGGVAYFFSSSSPNVYRSTSSVLLTSERSDTTSELLQGTSYVENLVATYVVLAQSQLVLEPVIDELELDTSVQSLAAMVTASTQLNTLIIDVSVTAWSPTQAQELAAAVTESLTRVVTEEVSPTTAAGNPTVRLTIIQEATEPRFPIAPNNRVNTLIGILAGLVVGVVYALIRSLLWNTVRSATDIAQVTTVPVVGEVVETKRDATLPSAILTDPVGIEAESVRSAAANLNFLKLGDHLRSFVVTSASPAESKSSIVTSLGIALAESGKRVLLVDADLRHPSLETLTGLEGSVGLTNVLLGETELAAARQPWAVPGLHVLTTGPIPPNPGQVLASEATRQFIAAAQDSYDVVIVDSAPLLSVSDAKWLGAMTDGALLITRYEKTSTRSLRRLIEALDASAVPALGIVITRMPRRVRARYGNVNYGMESAEKRP